MSCATNILQLVDDILVDCMGNAEAALLMCDLSAAFTLVQHQVLLDKLALYGLSEAALAWFKSYLQGREQYVDEDPRWGLPGVHCWANSLHNILQ